ncbi:DUF2157 domain-containing protein [Paractinoplanes atraurantiacus]|nr:DUF2157 domain-containing protein [Actinoplanes atraurantiacus]
MADQIDRWAATGLVTNDQAERMRADLPATAPHRSLAAEGLGYSGGSLVTVALLMLSSHYWTALGTAGRLLAVGSAGILLVTGGLLTPRPADGVTARLRAVLWLSGTAAAFASLLLAGSLAALPPGPELLPWAGIGAAGLAWGLLAAGGVLRPAPLGRTLGGHADRRRGARRGGGSALPPPGARRGPPPTGPAGRNGAVRSGRGAHALRRRHPARGDLTMGTEEL